MRKALNENRTVQLVLIGVTLAAAGLLMAARMKSGGAEVATSAPAATAAPEAGLGSATSSADPAALAATSTSAATAAPVSGVATASSVPTELLPPPPADLLRAYSRGDAIALLVVRGGGIEDALVRGYLGGLEGQPGVAVYATRAEHIARYASLTQGVNVNRVPALVVVKPRRLSGGQPTATVSYGFRSAQSIVQAVHDALYEGGKATYYPR
jgi:hypothetical protein